MWSRMNRFLPTFKRFASSTPTKTTTTTITAEISRSFGTIKSTTTAAPRPVSKLTKISKYALGGILVGGAAGLAYIQTQEDLKEQLGRTVYFWRKSLPIYLHYRFVEWQIQNLSDEEQDKAYEKLHQEHVDDVTEILLHLKGLYTKLAQVASTREDFVPKVYLERFSEFQDKVPARSGEEIRGVIEEAFGKKLEDVFEYFDPVALGAASIGQVHAAKLKDGTEVVVKVQYPGMMRIFRLDLGNSKMFARLAQPEQLPMFDELEKQVMTEFDFKREARMLELIRENIMPHFSKEVVIPRPIPGLVTENVFVMERIPGIKLVDGIKQQFEEIAKAQGVSLEELKKQAKENPPTQRQMEIFKWRSKIVTAWKNTGAALHNYTWGLVSGKQVKYQKPLEFIDQKKILDTLMRVHGHQVFVNGLFNGDCHPGNIILMPDGRLGLIDYGQVKELSKEQRLQLSELIIALSQPHAQPVIDSFVKMGFRSKSMNPYVIEKTARVFFDTCDRQTTEGLNLQAFMEKLTATDPTVSFPDEHLFAARTSLLIRGLGTILGSPVSTSKSWLPFAQKVVEQHRAQSQGH